MAARTRAATKAQPHVQLKELVLSEFRVLRVQALLERQGLLALLPQELARIRAFSPVAHRWGKTGGSARTMAAMSIKPA